MKQFLCVTAVVSVGAMLLFGCGKKEEPSPPSAPATPQVKTAAPSTTAPTPAVDIKAEIEKALALAKEGKYNEALAALQKLAQNTLSADQKKSLDDAIAQIQKWAAEAAAKAGTPKAADDLKKSLPQGLPR